MDQEMPTINLVTMAASRIAVPAAASSSSLNWAATGLPFNPMTRLCRPGTLG
ncbi:hypothetical protein D3C71_2018870 [compost metagenome]